MSTIRIRNPRMMRVHARDILMMADLAVKYQRRIPTLPDIPWVQWISSPPWLKARAYVPSENDWKPTHAVLTLTTTGFAALSVWLWQMTCRQLPKPVDFAPFVEIGYVPLDSQGSFPPPTEESEARQQATLKALATTYPISIEGLSSS